MKFVIRRTVCRMAAFSGFPVTAMTKTVATHYYEGNGL